MGVEMSKVLEETHFELYGIDGGLHNILKTFKTYGSWFELLYLNAHKTIENGEVKIVLSFGRDMPPPGTFRYALGYSNLYFFYTVLEYLVDQYKIFGSRSSAYIDRQRCMSNSRV